MTGPATDTASTHRWAILFDLDDTLVQTTALALLRQQRAWSRVYAQFDQTYLEPGLREMLSTVQGLGQLGVVTMAPRPYAERLLAHHSIDMPVLVAYHDVTRRKPDPQPILVAAAGLGLRSERVIYIGDEPRDIEAASRAGAHPVGYDIKLTLILDPTASLARAIARDWPEVVAAVQEIVGV